MYSNTNQKAMKRFLHVVELQLVVLGLLLLLLGLLLLLLVVMIFFGLDFAF